MNDTVAPARNRVGIDFSVPSAFLAQVTPESIPTLFLAGIAVNEPVSLRQEKIKKQ